MKYVTTLSLIVVLLACAAPEEPAAPTAEPVANSQDELIRNAERAGSLVVSPVAPSAAYNGGA